MSERCPVEWCRAPISDRQALCSRCWRRVERWDIELLRWLIAETRQGDDDSRLEAWAQWHVGLHHVARAVGRQLQHERALRRGLVKRQPKSRIDLDDEGDHQP